MNIDDIINQVNEDIKEVGTRNYEACYDSNLHLNTFSTMTADKISMFFLEMLEKNKSMDCYVASVLMELFNNKEKYGLSKEWCDVILSYPELRIF